MTNNTSMNKIYGVWLRNKKFGLFKPAFLVLSCEDASETWTFQQNAGFVIHNFEKRMVFSIFLIDHVAVMVHTQHIRGRLRAIPGELANATYRTWIIEKLTIHQCTLQTRPFLEKNKNKTMMSVNNELIIIYIVGLW